MSLNVEKLFIFNLDVLSSVLYRWRSLEGGDRDNLVEKKESPKEERVVKPVISLSGKIGY